MLALLGLPFRLIEVDITRGQSKADDFLSLNPRGQVPALRDGDTVVWDSMAILCYLATKYDPRYLPSEPAAFARTMQWLAVSENELLYGLARARAYFRLKRTTIPLQEAQTMGASGLRVLEGALAGRNWLVGDGVTIADIACYPYVRLAEEGQVSLADFSAIGKWIARIESLPGFVSAPGTETVPQA